jgi:predicted ATPase/DNA-binding SARP family transcriptional activator
MARLSLSLLGPVQITLDGHAVSGFIYNKARALLAYVAVESARPHQRDALVALLWPELADSAARTNLRQALANLRDAIDDAHATPPFLLITRESIQFNQASDYDLDLAHFSALLDACDSHHHRHSERCHSCAARMTQAIDLYRGDFLLEFGLSDSAPFDEWQLRHREHLHQRATDTLFCLANYHERYGALERARYYAQRQIDLDPWSEEAHRQLMRLLAQAGQRSAALAQYEKCRQILMRDLGVTPAAETSALYGQIRDGAQMAQPTLPAATHDLHHLPGQVTRPIGRERELADLGSLLEQPSIRLITITGPGGIGKTCLALAAAAEQAAIFTHGAAFVPLAGIGAAAFGTATLVIALGIALLGHHDPRAQLLDYLREKELLLILDNFEHLLAPSADHGDSVFRLLEDILQHAPGVTVLVTSRERLGLPGEWLFDLPNLSYPHKYAGDEIQTYSAVQLFVQRARQVRREFVLTEHERPAVLRICQQTEGLPLAIELAAAALRVSSCAALAAAIESGLSELSTTSRAIPARHRSISAAFEHSWLLLSELERRVFARLSVFRGGFLRTAAAAVAQATPEILAALVDKSLLRWDGDTRYTFHELIWQYACEKLSGSHESDDVRRRHLEYFLAIAEQAEHELIGPQHTTWLKHLDDDLNNMRVALEWSLRHDCESGLRLAGALAHYWEYQPSLRDGVTWLTQLLERSQPQVPSSVRAKALVALGCLNRGRLEFHQVRPQIEQGLALYRTLGDQPGIAFALYLLGRNLCSLEDYAAGYPRLAESLALYRALGDKAGIAQVLIWWGIFAENQDYERRRGYLEESITLFRELGHVEGLYNALTHLGMLALWNEDLETAQAQFALLKENPQSARLPTRAWNARVFGELALCLGQYDQARRLFEESIALCRESGQLMTGLWSRASLGYVVLYQGDVVLAYTLFLDVQRQFHEIGSKIGVVYALEGIASLATMQHAPERAVRLFAWADHMRAAIGDLRSPTEQRDVERDMATLQAQLDAAGFAAAWAAGAAMDLEEAIGCAHAGFQSDRHGCG